MDEKDETELSQLEVVTVGLVKSPAVDVYGDGSNIFLVKADDKRETPMSDDIVIEEVPSSTVNDPTFWNKVEAFVSRTFQVEKAKGEEVSKPDKAAVQQAVRILRAGGYDVSADDLMALVEDEGEEDEEMEMGNKKPMKKADETTTEGVETVEEKTEQVQETTGEAQNAPVDAAVMKAYEDRLAEIEKQAKADREALVKAQDALAKAEDDRVRREWLEKAGEMTFALPVAKNDLAEHLHAIAKAAPAEAEWLVTVFKAADHSLMEAGLFNELGTSQSPEQKTIVEKANQIAKEKNIPYEEALLSLPIDDQEALLKEMRGGK